MITKKISALQAVKYFCRECMGFNAAEVRRCTAPHCPLYPYRNGKTGMTRDLTDEQRQALSERVKTIQKMHRGT